MVTLIWNRRVYQVEAEGFYAARELLGVPDDEITPWDDGPTLDWVKRYELDSLIAIRCSPFHLTNGESMVELSAVEITLHGTYPACEADCPYSRDCANHTTAGDYRTEDGLTPDLHLELDGWKCSKQPKQTGQGARCTGNTFANDWR
jgi:hypothetical protein